MTYEILIICIFWTFIYVLIGCLVNAFIIVLEAREKGEVIIDGQRLKEVYQIFLWPIAFIEYIIKSWKKIKEPEQALLFFIF